MEIARPDDSDLLQVVDKRIRRHVVSLHGRKKRDPDVVVRENVEPDDAARLHRVRGVVDVDPDAVPGELVVLRDEGVVVLEAEPETARPAAGDNVVAPEL